MEIITNECLILLAFDGARMASISLVLIALVNHRVLCTAIGVFGDKGGTKEGEYCRTEEISWTVSGVSKCLILDARRCLTLQWTIHTIIINNIVLVLQ